LETQLRPLIATVALYHLRFSGSVLLISWCQNFICKITNTDDKNANEICKLNKHERKLQTLCISVDGTVVKKFGFTIPCHYGNNFICKITNTDDKDKQ